MVVLKKIKGSTLMETLVATVLIVVIFMISSMILNSLFSNTLKNNTHHIETHLSELEYLYTNKQLQIPYSASYDSWTITVDAYQDKNQNKIAIDAVNQELNKTISHHFFERP